MSRTNKLSQLACSGCNHRWTKSGYSYREKTPGLFVKIKGHIQTCPLCGKSDFVQILYSPEKPLPKRYERKSSQPQIIVSGGIDAPAKEIMPPSELEYRTMLQESILWATKQVMETNAEEIKRMAEARVKTLMELRK